MSLPRARPWPGMVYDVAQYVHVLWLVQPVKRCAGDRSWCSEGCGTH